MASAAGPIGLLVMAYGSAAGPDDIERYYTDIRGGRPPSPAHLQELKDRYAAIGNVFPLLDTTRAQAEGLVERLNASSEDGQTYRAYLGMKHSPPFIPEGVAAMRADGVTRAVGIVMAPHWSGMSVETYVERTMQAADPGGGGPEFSFVRSYSNHPAFIRFLTTRVDEALGRLESDQREKAAVVFSAHSLPTRRLPDGSMRCRYCDCADSCRYRDGLLDTADAVAARLHLPHHTIAWQSAGRTDDPWWGPRIEDVIPQLAAVGHPAVVVCSAGFVADHLEILFDLDVEAKGIAEEAGVRFERTRMPNADPAYLDVLAGVVRDHLAGMPEAGPDRPSASRAAAP
jgi:protoporphyrin/coproporphyrin ferrochelatase